ncbi:MAG: AraC family transcriptional regulator, partial [Azospira oryzae]
YYVYTGDDKKALEYLAQFSKEDKYVYWVLLMENDPMLDHLKKNPEFQKVVKEIKDKFWRRNKEIKAHMEEKGLM